jgi:hypothetical protein
MKPVPAFPMIPENDAEVRAIFGDIRRSIRNDGTLSPQWEIEQIVRIELPEPVLYAYSAVKISRITVHKRLADVALALYASIWEKRLADALGPYGGGFVYRPNANNKSDISLHAYGIAWDWDPSGFPNKSTKKRDPELVAEFERFGFLCGQNFGGAKDAMHFQFARGT